MDRRAREVPREYRTKFSTLDRLYNGTVRGQVGPLQERLQSMGDLQCLVVGRFGEARHDLHVLVKRLAEARANNVARAMGHPTSASETGVILAQGACHNLHQGAGYLSDGQTRPHGRGSQTGRHQEGGHQETGGDVEERSSGLLPGLCSGSGTPSRKAAQSSITGSPITNESNPVKEHGSCV